MTASPNAAARVFNGYSWRLSAAAPVSIDRLLESFPALESFPGARVLKSNHFRTVLQIPIDGEEGSIIAKVYRYTSGWDRARYRVLRHRALQEWTALERFRELGLPTARAMAIADLRRGGSFEGGGLIVSFLDGTEPLNERLRALTTLGRIEESRALLARTGKLVRKMHDCGVWHRDLHSGNILAKRDGDGLYIIDLHTCYFLRRLAGWQRRGGVAKLLQSLRGTLEPQELRVLIEAYGPDALSNDGTLEGAERLLLGKMDRLRRKRWKSRAKRCFLPSTQFTVSRSRDARTYHLRAHAASELEPLFRSEPCGRVVKSSERGWVAAARLAGVEVCVKHRRYSLLEGLQALFESHRLRRAYAGGHALTVRGIPTPQVIALREERRLGIVRSAHLVTERVPDAAQLEQFLLGEYWGRSAGREQARRKHALARRIGGLVRDIHDAGFYPHDLSPQNIILSLASPVASGGDAEARAWIADLDHLYLWQKISSRGRLRNLAEVSNMPEGHVGATDLFRGLRAYARGDEEYFEPKWIQSLRRAILAEHFAVLENRGSRGATGGAAGDA